MPGVTGGSAATVPAVAAIVGGLIGALVVLTRNGGKEASLRLETPHDPFTCASHPPGASGIWKMRNFVIDCIEHTLGY